MAILTILLTIIQFGILFFLFFSVNKIMKLLKRQQADNHSVLLALKEIYKNKE